MLGLVVKVAQQVQMLLRARAQQVQMLLGPRAGGKGRSGGRGRSTSPNVTWA